MRTATTLTAGLLAACAALALPVPARAWWYARPGAGGAITCVEAEPDIDSAWVHVNQGWARASGRAGATCPLVREEARLVVGYTFDCGQGGQHLFLRTQEHCATFKQASEGRQPILVEAFAPAGTRNVRGYLGVLGTCLASMVETTAVDRAGLQSITALCECQAKQVGAQPAAPQPDAVKAAMKACLDALQPADRYKLMLDLTPARKPAPAAPAPAKGKK